VSAAGDRLQDTARRAAMALPDVSHGYPFTAGLDVYKAAGKVFLIGRLLRARPNRRCTGDSGLLAVFDERDQLVCAGDMGTGFTDIALRPEQ
jgi:hypothetical protein